MTIIVPNRCRLVLVVSLGNSDCSIELENALSGGDVASVILHSETENDGIFQSHCENLVSIAQKKGVAAVVANDTRVAGRSNADGVHLDLPGGEAGIPELTDILEKFRPGMMVGCGNVKTRHMALSLGDLGPDYLFFGSLSGDIKLQAHPKMLLLAEWWAQMVEIPGICMGGSDIDSTIDVAKTGIDFIALSSAIFSHEKGAKKAVQQVNQMLDNYAPEFEDV